MKKAIGYSYFNGEKEHTRALDPWYPQVDYIIALDGRYRTPLPPWVRAKQTSNYSTDGSEHVLKTCYGDKLIHEKIYDTQIHKRQRYMDIAGELGCDYLIVWDSDDIIHPEYQDFDYFNKRLERELKPEHKHDRNYLMWAWIPDEATWSKQNNEVPSNIWNPYTRIHKNPGTMRYCQSHWTFCDKNVTDHEINLWKWKKENLMKRDWTQNPYYIKSPNTIDGVRITTDRKLRTVSDLEWGESWSFQQIHYEVFHYELEPLCRHKGITPYTPETGGLIGMGLPMEKYFFKPAGWQGDQHVGQIILINDDGSCELTIQEFENEKLTIIKAPEQKTDV